jgi:hypothetical protein
MARTTVVHISDDIDGSDADQTIRFVWGGSSYEIDLSAENAAAFEKVIEPYVAAARRHTSAGRGSRAKRPAVAGTAGEDLAALRVWAAENGHKVADRGRIATAVVAAFHAAQATGGAAVPKPAKKSAVTKAPTGASVTRKAVRRRSAAGKTATGSATAKNAPAATVTAVKAAAKKAPVKKARR